MVRLVVLAMVFAGLAASPGVSSDFGYGAVYGNDLGCIHAGGGDGSDGWATLSVEGIERHESACDFISLNVGRNGDYLASAICYSEGYTYPDLFTLSPTWDEKGISVVSMGEAFGEPQIFTRCAVE